ncbi:MAG: hypothetical protein KDB14_02305, partial [Planctomycetales bacterium]|nr:hypothetical protein [Planctomycetales bacterium]
MAPPIEMVKLHIRTHYDESMADFCALEVERQWLEQRIPAAPGEIAQIVVGIEELTQWVRQTSVAHPLIGTYRSSGAHEVFSLNLAAMINHPDQIQFYVSVAGPITRSALHPHHHECFIHYGSVRVHVPEGFRSSFFGQHSTLTFAEWHRRLWSEPDVAVSGLAFGSQHCELELLKPSNRERRRVRLISRDRERQLWQLSECGDADTVRPDQVLREMRESTRQLLRAHNQGLRVAEQSVGGDRAPGVYYLREAELRTLVRPDFGIEFLGDGGGSRIWQPRTLRAFPSTQGSTAKLELTDADEIAALEQSAVESVAEVEQAILELTWDVADAGASREWRFATIHHPDLVCIGTASAKLQDDYAWMFGNAMPQPPSLPEPMPGWTRLHLPDTSMARASDHDRALTLGTRSAESNWLFYLQPTERSEVDPANIMLTLEPSRISVQMFRGDLSAASPVVSLYPRRLTAQQSPPNAKRLQGVWLTPPTSTEERTTLASTRLMFAVSRHTGDNMDGKPRLEIKQDSPLLIVSKFGAAVSFAPYVKDAGIDFLSAGARNLEQSIDARTLRPLVERDRTQTLTSFPLHKFYFGS